MRDILPYFSIFQVNSILELFPDRSEAEIVEALKGAHFDEEAAVEALLSCEFAQRFHCVCACVVSLGGLVNGDIKLSTGFDSIFKLV